MNLAELFEMTTPVQRQKNKIYYHGTKSLHAATEIYKHGLDPKITEIKYAGSKSIQIPQHNRVYITTQLNYAMIYALGGNYFEDKLNKDYFKNEPLGFIFEINGNQLSDIIPDEDSIGERLNYFAHNKNLIPKDKYKAYAMLYSLALEKLTPLQMKKVKEGVYNDWIRAGKKLSKFIFPELALELIDTDDFHIAHLGNLKISKCYSFLKEDSDKIKKDGSNFFNFAKEWKPSL